MAREPAQLFGQLNHGLGDVADVVRGEVLELARGRAKPVAAGGLVYRGCCMNLASSIYGSPRTGYTSTKEGL